MRRGDAASALERLPGVLAATVFTDVPGPPLVYLATTPDANVGALRNAAAHLLADHGTPTPIDRIHVASPAPGRAGAARGALPRFSFDGFEVHRSDGRVSCEVRLRSEYRPSNGSATEPDTPSGRARAAARAALTAAEGFDPDFRLGLEGLRIVDLFGREALVLLVDATAGRRQSHLPGTALVDRSLEEAAALAVVHALRSWTA